jgi:hypothetical protein
MDFGGLVEISSLSDALISDLKNRFWNGNTIPEHLMIATALDPRFKNLNFFGVQEKEFTKEKIIERMLQVPDDLIPRNDGDLYSDDIGGTQMLTLIKNSLAALSSISTCQEIICLGQKLSQSIGGARNSRKKIWRA